MQQRFGLTFMICDREYTTAKRQERGYSVNPWTTRLAWDLPVEESDPRRNRLGPGPGRLPSTMVGRSNPFARKARSEHIRVRVAGLVAQDGRPDQISVADNRYGGKVIESPTSSNLLGETPWQVIARLCDHKFQSE